ncbi:DUF1942 domain-containing protein [Mycolicibacterium sp. P1-18]|uniref:MPT63 family protein n=1 Tax=Mycolicibacterium sp. P1-18 TaxID=2024615 RepID=UPI0011F0E975|nr:MPT63 family protein [Mycolicibacterium sp. P1-18]KAA0101836.1 DUF1942 domain-containing protein [Mycolicibacterium sp. P1-18]
MQKSRWMAMAVAPLAVATIGLSAAGEASATTVTGFGTMQTLDGPAGDIGYTVKDLRPSSDRVPVPVNGRLYEATTTAQAVRGSVQPVIPQFNARAANGNTYPVLFQAATPQGLDPQALNQGDSHTGKLYFDVTGADPNSVVVNNGAEDLLIWVR